jgi:hypothetical protein
LKRILKSKTIFFLLISLLYGCHVKYSFTGASISPDVKSFSVKYFPNMASLGPPTLSQTFTEALKDRFLSQTNLTLMNKGGDLNIEGNISNFSTQPIAISGETAQKNRLSVTVYVKFSNKLNEKQDFETSFTRYEDYDSSQNLSSIQDELLKTIIEALVDDIFNKAVVNW